MIKETATVPCLMLFLRVLQILWTYWWGRTKTKISASLVASRRSGTATCNQGKKVRTKVCLTHGQKEKVWSKIQKSNLHLKSYCLDQIYRYINLTYCSCQTYRNQSTNHIFWEFDAWQVLDVFMLSVDDLRQLPAINHLFVHVHLNFWVESFLPLHHIFSKNFGNRRPPDKKKFPLTECFNLCEAFDRKYMYLSNFSLEYVYHHLICFTSQKNNNSCWCFNL